MMTTRWIVAASAAALFAVPTAVAAPAPAQLQAALASFAHAHPTFSDVSISVRSPQLTWTGGAKANAPFRIASVTKTFVATATLRLVEQGRLRLDDPVSRHLDGGTVALLRSGGYAPNAITIRELLKHTSGIYDYAGDPAFQTYVLSHGRHHWTRAEQVRFAVAHGKPFAAPGAQFHYSDTGYILLGEIVERTTRHDLAWAFRHLLGFDRLGLRSTYLESFEPAAGGPRAHQFYDRIDATRFDPSFDLYGGGGLVSTTGDLTRFYDALLGGRVFAHRATLRTMLGKANARGVSDLGMGIFSEQYGGHDCWSHSGFWGTTVVDCPASRTTIAVNVNQADGFDEPVQRFLAQVLRILG
jgi:D-alanyl-D-alanine carboxypeptidase